MSDISHSTVELREEPQPLTTSCDIEMNPPPEKRRIYVSAIYAEIRGKWNLVEVFRKLGTREQAVAFAEDLGMIPSHKMCQRHRKAMKVIYYKNNTVGSFICNKGTCKDKTVVSRGKGTWFENVRISMPRVFYLMYAYASKFNYETTAREDFTESEHRLSSKTISHWFSFCRETVVLYQMDKQTSDGKIGGPGKIVQIDESKFAKRKFDKGRHIEGLWVMGMIEEGSDELRLEICPDDVQSSEGLLPLIKKHVEEGTTINTNCWRAYEGLENHGYIHKKVNNRDPENPFMAEDGTSTQKIVAQWRVIKNYLMKDDCLNTKEYFTDYIYEYLWRRNIQKNKRDAFKELIEVVCHVYKNN